MVNDIFIIKIIVKYVQKCDNNIYKYKKKNILLQFKINKCSFYPIFINKIIVKVIKKQENSITIK